MILYGGSHAAVSKKKYILIKIVMINAKDVLCAVLFGLFVLFMVLYITKPKHCQDYHLTSMNLKTTLAKLLDNPSEISPGAIEKLENLQTALTEAEHEILGPNNEEVINSLPNLVGAPTPTPTQACMLECVSWATTLCGSGTLFSAGFPVCFFSAGAGLADLCGNFFCYDGHPFDPPY